MIVYVTTTSRDKNKMHLMIICKLIVK